MQLLGFLLLILLLPYAGLTALGALAPAWATRPATRGCVSLSTLFAVTGLAHFTKTESMAAMMPPWFPARVPVIYLTGILELIGAITLWIPRLQKLTGICLIVMLAGFLPVNIYAALHRIPLAGHELGPLYLAVRVPIQLLLIAWTYLATGQAWFRRDP